MENSDKTGILLINLGTPDSYKVSDVRKYLREFLSDPRVIDLPTVVRQLLLNFIILPFRSPKSAEAYKAIWTEQGSPLLKHSKDLAINLDKELDNNYKVSLGMRYGNPSIKSAIEKLKKHNCNKIIVIPLFPQYASASTGSALEEVMKIISKDTIIPEVKIISDFYNNKYYINALSIQINEYLTKINHDYEYLLMSYHGLPERQVIKSETIKTCDRNKPCPSICESNRYCYRAQCYETSRFLAVKLNIGNNNWGVSFQSRLGKTPWIKPYTDEVLKNLAKKGIKKIAICCPAFVADCLETIEEIGIQAKEQWLNLGGKELHLIPCLNSHPEWVKAIKKML